MEREKRERERAGEGGSQSLGRVVRGEMWSKRRWSGHCRGTFGSSEKKREREREKVRSMK